MKPQTSDSYHSENTSNISVSTMETPMAQDHQEHPQAPNPDLVLDLSLSNKESDHESKPELNLIHCFDPNTSAGNNSSLSETTTTDTDHDLAEPRVFSCNYCQRKFYSSQALGGHQNAHKRERTLAKKGHRNIVAAASNNALIRLPSLLATNRFSSMASLPLHGSFNRSLGIQVHSTIHKPCYNLSNTFGGGHNSNSTNGRRRQPIDQQPAIGRLGKQNNVFHVQGGVGSSSSSSSGGGIGRFSNSSSVRMFSPATSEGVGGLWWNNSTVGHFKTKQDELQKLDLTLKL